MKKKPIGKSKPRSTSVGRKSKNTFVTKSGQSIKINRSLTDKIKARKDAYTRARAKRLAGMPKSRVKRFFYRLHPKRMYAYWFSREGGIMALKVAGIGIIAGFLLLVGLFAYFRKDLPNLRDISGNNIGGSIRYYDRTEKHLLWEDFDAVKRVPVEGTEMSQYIKDATIAIEDQEFFNHGGFDMKGISRAAFNNFTGGSTQGGSTITQQLVRLTQSGVGQEQTYTRKLKELILSVELERSYSKQEILTGYLNTAPYGNVQYGVETAARDYFQKSAKDLTLEEAAFLAAMPQSPSYYSPYGASYNPEALIGRMHYILDEMERQGKITAEERDKAKEVKILAKVKEPKPKYTGITAPWFVLTAKENLEEKFGGETVQRGGWKVTTTLDLDLQRIAEKKVSEGIGQVRAQGGDVAAFVAEDVKTGQIVSLVGGSDFNNEEYGQNNYARYRLPPGSSFKPYDYAALIEKSENIGAGSVLYDTQGPIPGYPCTNKQRPKQGGNCLWNYDFRYPGPLTLRYALGGSRNIPAVKAMLTVGVQETIAVADSLGLKSGYKCYADEEFEQESECYASSAIGDGAYVKMDEHVHAFGTLSRNGKLVPQTYIMKITDAGGKTITEWEEEEGEQVIKPDTAYIISDMMSDPRASYMSRKPHRYNGGQGEWKFAVKTGTTNDSKDGWMMGYSSKYAAGVWVGYHNRTVEMSGFMENMTQPIWQGWMQEAHNGKKAEDWPKPEGIQTLPAFVVRSHVGVGSIEPSPTTDLFPSWYKKNNAKNKKQTIDIVSNKLATECTPPRAKKDVTGGDAGSFSADQFVGDRPGVNTEEKDDVHKCDDVKPSARPASVKETSPGTYQVTIDVTQGTHPLSSDKFPGTLTVSIDGKQVHSQRVSNSGNVRFTYKATSSGNKRISATIVDSVLYDNTDTGSFNFKTAPAAVSGPSITSASADDGEISWSGGNGNVIIKKFGSGETICNSGSGSCSGTISEGDLIYAEDSDGKKSGNFTVTD